MDNDFNLKIDDGSKKDDIFGTKTQAVPAPEKNIGVDTNGEFISDLIAAGQSNQIDMSEINKFCRLSQSRDQMYAMIDTMAEDSTISAVLETYAEDATEPNFDGKIVWASSDDSKINQFVNFLIDSINVDKHIYKWMYSLCKYGDCYLRLYRKSEFYDDLFDDAKERNKNNRIMNESLEQAEEKDTLTEDVNVKVYSKNDKYVHYLEMVPNPAEMYELTRFGKSYAYIQAPVSMASIRTQTQWSPYSSYQYQFRRKDINLYDATNFVHAILDDNSNRVPERVRIFRGTGELNSVDSNMSSDTQGDTNDSDSQDSLSYDVQRGQSLLANSFQIWREMGLLENALLLNRITKSSFIRVLNIEVGDMPKEQIGPHLQGIKQLIEQKAAINTNESMSEYVNPGPMENTIYVPTHGGQGTISPVQIGGEVDVKGLADIDYFRDKLFGCLRGSTKIKLSDGNSVPIKEGFINKDKLIGKITYSKNSDGSVEEAKITDVFMTNKTAKFIRITLEDDTYVDVTPEHKMMLSNGTFKLACELNEDDELMTI